MVDKDGRTFDVEAGPSDEWTVQTFERLQQSEVLTQLKDQILLPLLDQRLKKP
jgi:hypothetical protein